jgi:thioesterase domain-containing protein
MLDEAPDALRRRLGELSPERRALVSRWLRERSAEQPVSLPLVRIARGAGRPALFCVHGEGGGAGCYVQLAARLDPRVPVYGLQARGFEDGGEPQSSVPEMAAYYLRGVLAVQPRGPYLLTGWCLGGIIAFEMACQLARDGHDVGLLALLDVLNPPFRPVDSDGLNAVVGILGLASILAGPDAGAGPVSPRTLSTLSDHHRRLSAMGPEERLDYLVEQLARFEPEQLRELSLSVPRNDRELLRRLIEVTTCNASAVGSYTPPVYPGRVKFLRAVDPLPHRATVQYADGWRPHARDGLEVLEVSGHHLSFLRPSHVESTAATLQACIDRAAPAGG